MIDIINKGEIAIQDRKDCISRALYTLPFFYKMEFPVTTGTDINTLAEQRLGIGRDFYFTEVIANFGEVKDTTGSFFNISLSTGYNRSLYRFEAGRELPTGFICEEARFRSVIGSERFVDRQAETLPFCIKQNESVYAKVTNTEAITDDGVLTIVLKGFILLDQSYLSGGELALMNESLSKRIEWDFFNITIPPEDANRGQRGYILENDKYPRLILGFGAINSETDKALISKVDIDIIDPSRRLQMTDVAIPLEYIAPRMSCLVDAHIYYLPTEYYFPPLGKLQFNANNIWINDNAPAGVQIAVLTRTP